MPPMNTEANSRQTNRTKRRGEERTESSMHICDKDKVTKVLPSREKKSAQDENYKPEEKSYQSINEHVNVIAKVSGPRK